MLELAVLGLLKEQEMHGYELKKRLSDVFGLSSAVSFGSLYPALARLEAAGAVSVVAGAVDGTAAAAGLAEHRQSRRRKVYRMTPLGTQMFEELLTGNQGAGEDERAFNLRLAFARYLPAEARLGLLERRRAVLGERLAQLAARARARRDDRYLRILVERQQEALSMDVSWLDRLIDEERGGGPARVTSPGDQPAAPPRAAQAPSGPAAPARLVPLASASQLHRAAQGQSGTGHAPD